jgi:tetrahydromethanopterin S-methyltransferase subunit B
MIESDIQEIKKLAKDITTQLDRIESSLEATKDTKTTKPTWSKFKHLANSYIFPAVIGLGLGIIFVTLLFQ